MVTFKVSKMCWNTYEPHQWVTVFELNIEVGTLIRESNILHMYTCLNKISYINFNSFDCNTVK